MNKKILINAAHLEEKRIAIIDGKRLTDFYVEVSSAAHVKGNIYKGVISALDKGLESAFVNFGPEKHGFLPLREVMPENYKKKTKEKNPRITEVLAKGQDIMVQVEQDQRGHKGAKLTNRISLPGRYLVMIPGKERVGISRKIEDKEARNRLKDAFKGLKVSKGMGFILRTAGEDCTTEDLAGDLKYLTKLWNKIKREARKATAPALIYKEEDIAVRAVRDYLDSDVNEVLVDDRQTLTSVKNFLKLTMPWRSINAVHYKQKNPLFDEHGVEDQITALESREAVLPSGGSIVIDRTEALTAIDVNSAKAKGKSTESLALQTNMEAAEEAARQLRLRDIGGLIVIDFIDLESRGGYRKIEETLRAALHLDKAHYDLSTISKFGLLEMSRERMRASYAATSAMTCPSCGRAGAIKSPELLAVSAMRKLHSLAVGGEAKDILCRLPVESANYLMNNLRESLSDMEKSSTAKISLMADSTLPPGTFTVEADGVAQETTEATTSGAEKKKAKKSPRRRKKKPAKKAAGKPSGAQKSPAETPAESDAATSTKPSAAKKRRDRRRRSAKKKAEAQNQ